MIDIFVPKPRKQTRVVKKSEKIWVPWLDKINVKIWSPEEAGAWEDGRGRWHYTLDNEPLLMLMGRKRLDVVCGSCGKRHSFKKEGQMGGWKPPHREHGRFRWLCPRC